MGNLRKAPPTEAPPPASYDDVPGDLDALAVGVAVRVLSGPYTGAGGVIRAIKGLSSQVHLPHDDALEWLPNWMLAPLAALESGGAE